MSGRSVFARGRVARTICALAGGSALLLAGCASNTEGGGTPSGEETVAVEVDKVDAIAATLPEKIASSGKIIVGVNIPYSPNEFKDPSGKIVGFDVDLVDAVSKVLGVTPEYTEADFDKIIPSIQAGSYDMGMSSFTDTKEREQSVDFTTYFSAGVQWAQPAGKSVDPTNACGLRVGVQTTTIEDLEEVPAKSAACVAAGKPPHRDREVRQPGRRGQRRRPRQGRRDVRRLARHRVRDQAERRQDRGRGRGLRRRAVRLARREGVAARPDPPAGAAASHRRRHIPDDRGELGVSRRASSPPPRSTAPRAERLTSV